MFHLVRIHSDGTRQIVMAFKDLDTVLDYATATPRNRRNRNQSHLIIEQAF
jgi:hypothetical protein